MTIEDVARRAKVSTATVSRVLSNSPMVRPKTAEHVRKVIADLNYIANSTARSLSLGKSHLFGVVISDITNPFFPDLVYTFEELAVQYKRGVFFLNTNYSTQRMEDCIQSLLERNVDGIAVMTSEMSEHLIERVRNHGTPIIFLDHPLRGAHFSNITIDYKNGIRYALDHLLMLGHTKIAFISGPNSLNSAVRRRQAFLDILAERSISIDKSWLPVGNHRVSGGQEAMRKILDGKRMPTAIMTSNDLTALGAIAAIYEAGLNVPSDFSVVGFDDIEVSAAIRPSLTTVRVSRAEIATEAFSFLYTASQHEQTFVSKYEIATKLIVRNSTAAPRKESVAGSGRGKR
jgi:DNA-binding LacI/PurR family transcriptional regulator